MPTTWLYVPADRLGDLLPKAVLRADAVVIDLEDATHPANRERARALVASMPPQPVPVSIRVNAVRSADFAKDVAVAGPLLQSRLIDNIRLPKIETPDDVASAWKVTSEYTARPHLTCQVESARGVRHAHEVAESDGVLALMLGEADLRADLGLPRSDDGLLLARLTVVQAARAAGLPAPIGSAFTNIADLDGLRASCQELRNLGFYGRSVIHPRQISVVREAFQPRAEEIAWAESVAARVDVMEETKDSSIALDDGSFIDPAVVRQARDLLARA